MRPALMFLAASAYIVCAYGQVFSNTFGTDDIPTEGYQLKGDWLGRLPQAHFIGDTKIDLTHALLDCLHEKLPEGGKVAVGSELIYVTSESLSWAAQREPALRGEKPIYRFENFLTGEGQVCRSALLSSRAVFVYIHPKLQYDRRVLKASNDLIQFSIKDWLNQGIVQAVPLQNDKVGLWGGCLLFKQPLTDAQISEAITATKVPELSPKVEFNPPIDHHLTWQECWDVLARWKEKRFGK